MPQLQISISCVNFAFLMSELVIEHIDDMHR